MQTVTTNTLTDTISYKNIPIVTYKINYPSFTTTCNVKAAEAINAYYLRLAQNTRDYCRNVIFAQAAQDLEYIQGTRPFNAYTLDVIFQITYNSGCITSLYTDTYTYTGGAHGQTIRLLIQGFQQRRKAAAHSFLSSYAFFPASAAGIHGKPDCQKIKRESRYLF